MQIINRIELTTPQQKVIKKIAGIQLRNLQLLLENKGELTLTEIDEELEPGSLGVKLAQEIERVEYIVQFPESFPGIAELDVFKHILHNFIDDEKYKNTKRNLWKKIFRMEKVQSFVHLN